MQFLWNYHRFTPTAYLVFEVVTIDSYVIKLHRLQMFLDNGFKTVTS